MTADSLRNLSTKFINEVQGGGDISKALNVSVKGLRISAPLPKVREDGNYETGSSAGKVTVPENMQISIQPTMGFEKLPFATQPCLQVFDVQEDPMALVGSEDDPWLVTANLVSDTPRSAQLIGNTTVKIVNGWANFTDLRISHYGEKFYIQFNKTYPEKGTDLINRTAYFTVNKLYISLRINVLKDKIIQNNATEVNIELFNKATGQQLKHLDMMGLIWTASVKLSNVAEPPGNMTGYRNVTFDPAAGEAVFNNLSFDEIGTYILEFAVISSSEEFIIYENVPVEVVNEKQLELLDSNTTLASKISLTFNESFQNIVGNKTDEFGAYIINILRLKHRNVVFENVTVTEGSIVLRTVIRASPVYMNNTLGLLSETIEANNLTFNGCQLRSPTLNADEKLQTTATTDHVSTGTTQFMTTPFETTPTFETTRTFETTTTLESTTFETTPTFETTTSEPTTTTVSSAAVLSVPVVVVIVVTPLAILLGVIFIVILLKYRKSQKHEMREHLTRPPAVSSDDFIPRKGKTSNEYSYLSPFSIGAHTKPQQQQISRLHSNLVLRPSTPTYEIQNQLPPSSVGSLGSATSENYRRRQYQSSGSDVGYLSRNNGKIQ